jgi:hypothetical protein
LRAYPQAQMSEQQFLDWLWKAKMPRNTRSSCTVLREPILGGCAIPRGCLSQGETVDEAINKFEMSSNFISRGQGARNSQEEDLMIARVDV